MFVSGNERAATYTNLIRVRSVFFETALPSVILCADQSKDCSLCRLLTTNPLPKANKDTNQAMKLLIWRCITDPRLNQLGHESLKIFVGTVVRSNPESTVFAGCLPGEVRLIQK